MSKEMRVLLSPFTESEFSDGAPASGVVTITPELSSRIAGLAQIVKANNAFAIEVFDSSAEWYGTCFDSADEVTEDAEEVAVREATLSVTSGGFWFSGRVVETDEVFRAHEVFLSEVADVVAAGAVSSDEVASPRILVTVSGGVADYVGDDGVEVVIFDYDGYKADPAAERVPAHFADLAKAVSAPYASKFEATARLEGVSLEYDDRGDRFKWRQDQKLNPGCGWGSALEAWQHACYTLGLLPTIKDGYADTIIKDVGLYDAIEIHGVVDISKDEDQTMYEVCEDEPDMYSVYVHLKEGGVECIGDFSLFDDATDYAVQIGQRYAWPCNSHLEL